MTPLHFACKFNNEDVAAMLIGKGADPTIKSQVLYCNVVGQKISTDVLLFIAAGR